MDKPLGVGREVGNDRTHQKRGIVIHGNANAEPSAQPDVEAPPIDSAGPVSAWSSE
jgi:hypothetical protein